MTLHDAEFHVRDLERSVVLAAGYHRRRVGRLPPTRRIVAWNIVPGWCAVRAKLVRSMSLGPAPVRA